MNSRQRVSREKSKTHAVKYILLALLGFLIVAGIAFGVGMVGNMQRWLQDLPDYSDADSYLASEPTTVVDRYGNTIASFYAENRKTVTQDQVTPYVLKGTVDVEDERFYQHNGIDIWGIVRAAFVTLTGGHQGASTITQQLVRNTVLVEEQYDQTIERKVREAYIAMEIEKIYSKDEILMMYLNTIYYGHGAYGIEVAAQTYFSKSAADLTLAEAAMLVGLPNAPSQYDPTTNYDYAVSRRNKVLDNMLRLGDITQEEHDAASAEDIVLNLTESSSTGVNVYSQPYFVDYVKSILENQFSSDVLFKGGLTVYTTIDPDLQAKAEESVANTLDRYNVDGLEAAVVVVNPETGFIRAMVGGRDYYADDYHVNHAISKRQTGSSFKAFTLATAIQQGMNPNININCSSPLYWDNTTGKATYNTSSTRSTRIQNYNNTSYGSVSLAYATAVSSNTGYVQVAEAVGNTKIQEFLEKVGINCEDDHIEDVLTMTLGTGSISPLEMATAYAVFADGGEYRESTAITQITNRKGETIYEHDDAPQRVMTAGEAAAVTSTLSGVMTAQGTGYYGRLSVNQPYAGKTGTTDSYDNLWFCGYTPQYSVAVWAGFTEGNVKITDNWGNTLHNTELTLPIWRTLMNSQLAGWDREEFPTGDAPTYKADSEWKFSQSGGSSSSNSSSNNKSSNGYSNNNYSNSYNSYSTNSYSSDSGAEATTATTTDNNNGATTDTTGNGGTAEAAGTGGGDTGGGATATTEPAATDQGGTADAGTTDAAPATDTTPAV